MLDLTTMPFDWVRPINDYDFDIHIGGYDHDIWIIGLCFGILPPGIMLWDITIVLLVIEVYKGF